MSEELGKMTEEELEDTLLYLSGQLTLSEHDVKLFYNIEKEIEKRRISK